MPHMPRLNGWNNRREAGLYACLFSVMGLLFAAAAQTQYPAQQKLPPHHNTQWASLCGMACLHCSIAVVYAIRFLRLQRTK